MSEAGTSEPRSINITQLATWLAQATSGNQGFLLKPNDLKMLYTFVLWNYISSQNPAEVDGEVPEITNDADIQIPEVELVRMVKLFFNSTYYPYFNRVFNM